MTGIRTPMRGIMRTPMRSAMVLALLSIYTGITPVVTASATTGPAPLGVFVNATATTAGYTSEPWRDLLYGHDSGDTAAGNYTSGTRAGASKRKCVGGPVFGYVYETPGSFTYKCPIWDGTGTVSRSISILVQDPNVVFSGTATVCCSTTGNFTGAPAGARLETVANLAAAFAFIGSNTRVMIQAADTWTTTTRNDLTGTKDNWQFTSFNGRAKITQTQAVFGLWWAASTVTRGCIHYLEIDGASVGDTFFGVATATDVSGITLHDITGYDIGGVIGISGTGRVRNFFAHKLNIDRVKGGAGHVGIFLQANNAAIIDCDIDDATSAEHNVRFQYYNGLFIHGNNIRNPAATKHAVTLRATNWTTPTVVGLPANSYSEYGVISDNNFASNTAQICTNTPQGVSNNEQCRNTIWERNYYVTSNTGSNTALTVTGHNIISRNEVFNCTGGGNNPGGMAIARNETFISTGIQLWNPTLYRLGNHNGMTLMSVTDSIALGPPTGTVVRGGLIYSPGTGTVTPVNLNGGAATVTNTNTTTGANAKTVNPLFVGPLTGIAGFALGPGSPYATNAALERNYSDALDRIRGTNGGAHMLASDTTSAWALFGP